MANTFKDYLGQDSLFGFDSSTGQLIPQTSNILGAIKALVSDIFENNITIEDETPIGRLCEAWALSFARFCSVTAVYANQINPQYATGQLLDALGSLFSVVRTGATPVIINCTFSGTVGTVIPAGSLISDGLGNQFAVQDNVTIGSGGTATGKAVCTTNGQKTIIDNSVTNIDSTVIGWSSVTNSGIDKDGTNIESDNNFRKRVLLARWTGTAFVEAIRAEIERINGIESVFIIENVYAIDMYLVANRTLSEYQPVSGKYIKLKPHSICVVVDYGGLLTTTMNPLVANAIYNTKSVGCDYTSLGATYQGSVKGEEVSQSVTDLSSGITYQVLFNKPQKISFGVDVTVARGSFSGTDTELITQVKDAIIAWSAGSDPFVDGLAIGQSIYSYEIGASISNVIPSIQIKNVDIINASSQAVSSIDIFVNEIGNLDVNNIDVTVES